MRVLTKRVALVSIVLVLVGQAVPVNRYNPPVDPPKTIYASQTMPSSVRSVLERSCNNCHSDETAWPWYSYVAPVSWVIARDVHGARKALNFSQWGNYSAQRKANKLEEMCEQVTNGDMPDTLYLLLHREAVLTQEERDAVCQWTEDSREY